VDYITPEFPVHMLDSRTRCAKFLKLIHMLCLISTVLLSAVTACGQDDWRRVTPESIGLDANRFNAMEAAINAGEFKKIGSVLVARHGKLAYEKYFEGNATTLRDTRSATKSITGLLVGLAIQDKKLRGVEAGILDLLPEHRRQLQNPDPRKEKITVEDLLTMSSPLECEDWNDASRGNEERMYLIEDWAQFILDLPIRGRMKVGEAAENPKYGRKFSYCTGGVFILSEVLSRTTGLGADRYADKELFGRLRVTHPLWVYSPLNIPQTGGGLRLNSPDLLKIAQLYLDGGEWKGERIINRDWVKESITPHAQINDHQEYGYLWWLQSFKAGDRSYPAFFMSGNGGNKVLGFPTLDLAVAITSTNYNTRGMHEQTDQLLSEYILAAVR
jgi:CubicO group peptidase (beta-lactamase class C family)